jgi:hypothetical protein
MISPSFVLYQLVGSVKLRFKHYNSNSIIMENGDVHGKTQSRIYKREKHGKHGKMVPVFLLFHVFRTFSGLPVRLNYSQSMN